MNKQITWIIAILAIAGLSYGAYVWMNSAKPVTGDIIQTASGAQATATTDPLANLIPTDYSKKEHWLSLPAAADKSVDVFYLYPTSWEKVNPSDPNVCNVDNTMMLKMSKLAFARTATAFEPAGNIYAPYYKQ